VFESADFRCTNPGAVAEGLLTPSAPDSFLSELVNVHEQGYSHISQLRSRASITQFNMMPTEQIRREAEQRIGGPVPDRLWNYVLEDGKVDLVVQGKKDLNWLTNEVWRLDDVSGGHLRERTERPRLSILARKRADGAIDRELAVSFLCAKEARADGALKAFRREVLKDQILSAEEVAGWINRQAQRDAGRPRTLLGPIPYAGKIEVGGEAPFRLSPPLHLDELPSGVTVESRLLGYGLPGNEYTQYIKIEIGGTLDDLYKLGQSLRNRYGWGDGEATMFVLTDLAPRVRLLSGSIRFIEPNPRVVLEIDPSISPGQVSAAYKEVRAKITKGARIRALSKKHLTLTAFVADRASEPWADRLAAWNRSYPKWRYSQESNFRRDVGQAAKRFNRLRSENPLFDWFSMMSTKSQKKGEERNGRIRPRKAKT